MIIRLDTKYVISAELIRKINSMPQENFAGQLVNDNKLKSSAFQVFMEKMNAAEKSTQEHVFYSEEEIEEELTKI